MNLPDSKILNLFNKVLISLSDLCPDENPCHVDSLINQCKSVAHGGQISVDYDLILQHCKFCGLVQIKKELINISVLGQKFLDSNRERYIEINEAQKALISERIVFRGAWSHHARALFDFFSPNIEKETYELSIIDSSIPNTYNSMLQLFKFLGILNTNETLISVEKKYSELVFQLTADRKALSELQLEKMIMENRKLGAKAENTVVAFEKKRLRKLGKFAQAELVRRISTTNVSAGYDIESFDGNSEDIFPNRFIEVKATQGNEIRFYWSNNERNIAKIKKESYWIYMIKNFKESTSYKSIPILIQNPECNISEFSYLSIEAHTYLIKEISNVELIKKNIQDLSWFELG